MGLALYYAGRLPEAEAQLLKLLELRPGIAAIEKESSEAWRMIGLPLAYHALGRKAESDAALRELT